MGEGDRHIAACCPDEHAQNGRRPEQCLWLHDLGRLHQYVVHNIVFIWHVIANTLSFLVIVSFGLGSLLLLAILIKYIHSRAALMSWNVRYGQNSSTQSNNPYSGTGSMPSGSRPGIPRKNIYDSWLAVRFTVAFVALGYAFLSP